MAVEKELLQGIDLLKEGKEEGFNILYAHTYNYVYGRAKVIMKNEDDALDLTQETFVQAYKGIQQLEDVNNIYAWLGSITYRQGMRLFRKKREVLVGEDAEGIFEDVEDNDSDYHPEASAEEKATADIIKSMIEELPELQKATIMAYYYDNMKIDEIAEVFACSSNTVKSRLNYAKKFLKTKVEEHEKENRYKLHSLTPAVLLLACKSLFTEKEYALAAETAQMVYDGACDTLRFEAKEMAEGVNVVEDMTTSASENIGTAASSTGAAGTTSAVEAGIGAAVTKTGLSVGVKYLLGVATALVIGAGGIAAATGNLDLQNIFQQEAVMQGEDAVQEEENQAGTEDSEETETTEEAEVVFDSYAEAAAFMKAPEYRVETSVYSEDAISLMRKFVSTMMLEKDMAFDMTELTEEQRQNLNYNLLNEAYGFGYEFIPASTETVTGGPVGIYYNTEVLNAYLDAFYEGGRVSEKETQYEQYTVFLPSDAYEYHGFSRYDMFQYEDYLLIEAECSYFTTEYDFTIPTYTASMLFKITENELYSVQMLHVNTYDKVLDETILLKEGYFCDTQNEFYGISISNIRDYGTYYKFDMVLSLENTQDMQRSINRKSIICFDAVLEGNVATFESTEEWYNPDSGYSDEEVQVYNGFYGTFTIQEDGTVRLIYDVKDNSDGWNLNKSTEPITLRES